MFSELLGLYLLRSLKRKYVGKITNVEFFKFFDIFWKNKSSVNFLSFIKKSTVRFFYDIKRYNGSLCKINTGLVPRSGFPRILEIAFINI